MLRERLDADLKTAMKAREQRALSTIRLILTAIKDRDIAARGKGNADGISDQEIFQVLQTMVRQRRDAIELYEQGGRLELAEQEADEIKIIEGFQPQQLDDGEIGGIVGGVIEEVGAGGLKDMGRVMGVVRERYAGQMDFGKASAIVKQRLGEFSQSRRLNFHLFHCSKILGQNSRWLRAKLSFCHLLCVVMHVAHHRPR